MAGILIAGSSGADLGLDDAPTTTSNSYKDGNYTIEGLAVLNGPNTFILTVPIDEPSYEIWAHFRWAAVGGNSRIGTDQIAVAAYDESNAVIGSLIGTSNNSATARSYGNSTVSGATATSLFGGAGNVRTIDVQVVVDPGTGAITTRVYSGGSLLSEATAPSSVVRPIRRVDVRSVGETSSASASSYYTGMSEIICTDGIPTLGMRLAQLRPAGAGYYSEMQGTWADLVNSDPGAAVVGNAAGQRFSWTKSAYAGAASPAAIMAVIGNITTSRMAGTPTKVNQFLRVDGEDFHADPISTNLRRRRQDVWWTNPKTGLPWVTADFAATQPGFRVTD